MPDYCDECTGAKTRLCPRCRQEFICGECETECLGCCLRPEEEYDQEDDLEGEDGCHCS